MFKSYIYLPILCGQNSYEGHSRIYSDGYKFQLTNDQVIQITPGFQIPEFTWNKFFDS
jgi:hypothetical protein